MKVSGYIRFALPVFAAMTCLAGAAQAQQFQPTIQIDGVKSLAAVEPSNMTFGGAMRTDRVDSVLSTRIAAQAPIEIGTELPKRYTMLLNTEHYGLPAPEDGWVYFVVDRDLYRVDLRSREVLERVTDQANRSFY